jgi:hypothetical protein
MRVGQDIPEKPSEGALAPRPPYAELVARRATYADVARGLLTKIADFQAVLDAEKAQLETLLEGFQVVEAPPLPERREEVASLSFAQQAINGVRWVLGR